MNASTFSMLLALFLLLGCQSPAVNSGSGMNEPLEINLRAVTTDGRFTHLVVDRRGKLHYAGGQAARFWDAQPVLTLNEEQQAEIRRVIAEHRLFEHPSTSLAKANTVTYALRLRLGNQRRSLRCVDDQATGVKALHDLLFRIQADYRYRLERY